MATKVIYFKVGDVVEKAEFRSDDTAEEVKEVFRAAAEAGPNDILKLYNCNGNLVNISPKLPENTPDTRYQLQCIAVHFNGPSVVSNGDMREHIEELEQKLQLLEKRILVESGDEPQAMSEVKRQVNCFREKLENLSHLSWLGLYKDISSGTTLQPFWSRAEPAQSILHSQEHCQQVFLKFLEISENQVSDEVRHLLRQPKFDNWQWEDSEMLLLLRQMFIDLELVTRFNIQMPVLHLWLLEIYKHYNKVPFHNFKHCFMVSQMMYGLIWLLRLPSRMEAVDVLSLLVASICHDLDHPGYNNAYQVNACTELAMRYNDVSPLENHHCSVAFRILQQSHCNILASLSQADFKRVRKNIIMCILATDMARHQEILAKFEGATESFDMKNTAHKDVVMQVVLKVADLNNEVRSRDVADRWLECLLDEWFMQLCQILIKVADVSNECRPPAVASPWLECLLEEYFAQSDVEKLEGLPVADFMDRDQVTKSKSQIGFIQFVLQPLFEALGRLFPEIIEEVVVPVRNAYKYYVALAKEEEQQKKHPSIKQSAPPRNGLTTPIAKMATATK